MSHNIEHFTYPLNVDKKKVKKELDNYVAHQDWQEGCTGLNNPIRWLDFVYGSYDEAERAIKQFDRGWYDQLAVKYYSPLDFHDDKTKQLEIERMNLWDEFCKRRSALYPKTLKSAFIGCKECGSRLAVSRLKVNQCPVCSHELRPDYILKSISAAKAKWERADDKLKQYIDKHAKKEIEWLVKIEYHT